MLADKGRLTRREAETLADLLRRIDWAEHPELARLLRSALMKVVLRNAKRRGRPEMLTAAIKAAVAGRYAEGERVVDLAREYGVNEGTIYRALAGAAGQRRQRKGVD